MVFLTIDLLIRTFEHLDQPNDLFRLRLDFQVVHVARALQRRDLRPEISEFRILVGADLAGELLLELFPHLFELRVEMIDDQDLEVFVFGLVLDDILCVR